MKYGILIKKIRTSKNLSLGRLAAMASISQDYLFRIEKGKVQNIGVQILERIAQALKVPMEDFFKSKDEEAA